MPENWQLFTECLTLEVLALVIIVIIVVATHTLCAYINRHTICVPIHTIVHMELIKVNVVTGCTLV